MNHHTTDHCCRHPRLLQEEAQGEYEALLAAKRALEASKVELEAKVAAAAGAIHAGEELKELRWVGSRVGDRAAWAELGWGMVAEPAFPMPTSPSATCLPTVLLLLAGGATRRRLPS